VRTGALVLGIIAGLFGIFSALVVLLFGGLGDVVDAEGAEGVYGSAIGAFSFGILRLLGAALALAKPRVAAALMVVSAVGITISISMFALIAAPLFLIAAALAFFGRH